MRNKVVPLVLLSLFLSAGIARADETSFRLVGRVARVIFDNAPGGPGIVRVFITAFVPGDNGAPGQFRTIDTLCPQSQWFFCRDISYMLGGPCGILHDTIPMTDFGGNIFFNDRFQCASPHAANCMDVLGTNTPERRGDSYVPGFDCQF